ncbi:S9 family peptidase [Alicyclobacillus ferrooxydans]|uniref:Peptidase S9 prolyl oligopeptidase catalytic domain-containing protein n=1 Tax=Alicyclobacillus ferrooxydans TaxID=471514 RepID=A0A0P9CTH1_9BACL|nr:S9 family peptidase [Alicyclobacillus ferrooxydans]KPV42950.1 hypothetical protein AN477_14800 [Alicyclobacillus ferrooxydans]
MQDEKLRYFSIEEMVALPTYMGLAISPDGGKVAYVERLTDWDKNRYLDLVWSYDKTSRQRVLVTSDKNGGSRPQWSLDGQQLAYVSSVEDDGEHKPQLFVRSEEDGRTVQVTTSKDGIGSYLFSPDGCGVYFLSQRPNEALKKRKEGYGDIEYVDVDYGRQTLYYVDLENARQYNDRFSMPKSLREDEGNRAEARLCVDRSDLHILEFDVSPDGQTIVFSAAPSPNFEDMSQYALYRFDVATKEVVHLHTGQLEGRIEGQVAFSPDGESFVFTHRTGDGKMFRNNALVIYHLLSGEIQSLPVDIDEQLSVVAWTEAGIVIQWQNRTNRWIERIELDGSRTSVVTGDGVQAFGASVSLDGHAVAYIQSTGSLPLDVYVDGHRITDLQERYTAHEVSERRVVSWQSRDGSEIEGVLCVPGDFDSSKRYPLLVVVHGGPTWASFPSPTQDKYYPIEQFIERGFIVLLPNYRGSSGYGEAFRALNERNLGIGDYEDVVTGVESLVHAGFADPERVGVMGWSQGGYISAFCTTFSRRFRAVSVGAGISNWVTYYVNTDIHPFTRHYLGDTPWRDPEVYRKTSPMTYIEQAATPTLIQHGDKDSRVPLPNAFELYQGLKDVGVETQLVVFKGMQHGSDKPGWNRAIMHQNYAWFCHHIFGDPLDAFWL